MQTELKARIDWIDTAKGCCILLVVFHHVIITSYSLPTLLPDATGELFFRLHEMVSQYLAPLRMPLFFILSGFLVHRSVTAQSWHDALDKRVWNLVYLFLLWGIIQWLTVYAINWFGQPDALLNGEQNAVYSRHFIEFISLTAKGSSSLWYLYALVFYFIVCKSFARYWWLALAIMLVLHWVGWKVAPPWPTKSIFMNGIYFAFGCFIGPQVFALLARLDRRSLLLIVTPIALLVVAKSLGYSMPLLTSFSMIFICAPLFAAAQRLLGLNTLAWIGRNTLQIYVLHRIFIELAGVIAVPMLFDLSQPLSGVRADLWLLLYPSVMTALIVVASLLCWQLSNRHFGRALYRLPERLKMRRQSLASESAQ